MPKIIRNNAIIQTQSEAMKKLELSNITLLTQQTPIFGTWYSIDPNLSEVVDGFRAVEEFIGPDSRVKYNKIEGIPVYFAGDFNSSIDFDAGSTGTTVSFNINGAVLPNSVRPKANDFFVPNSANKPTLMRVTDYHYNDFKENPMMEVTFDLASREQSKIDQLNLQIAEDAIFIISSIGTDRVTVISKTKYNRLIEGTHDYLAIVNLYNELFFNEGSSVYSYVDGGVAYEDRVFNTFLHENRIITMDPVITFAKSNMDVTIESKFLAYDPLESSITHTPFDFIVKQKSSRFTKDISQIKFYPDDFDRRYNTLITSGVIEPSNINKICWYDTENYSDGEPQVMILSSEYLTKVIANDLGTLNPNSLLATIVKAYNATEIDYSLVEIHDQASKENYYLIPLLLFFYRQMLETFK